MSKKVLIIDDVHELLPAGLQELGYEVTYLPQAGRSDLLHLISQYHGLVVRTKTSIDSEVINNGVLLEFIARAGSGMDNVDVDLAVSRGIACFNAGEANADAVGEHTMGMILSVFHKIAKGDAEVRSSHWDRQGNTGEELNGKTVAVIGYGNTGKAVAKKLSGFGVKVLAYDKYLDHYSDAYAQQSNMDEIFGEADLVTFHIPLTDETIGLVNVDYINKFSKNIWLFNLSRGKVIDTEAVVKALQNGKIKGCGLDVLENENPAKLQPQEKAWFEFLIQSNKTVLTPHVAGWSVQSYRKISTFLLQKIKELKKYEG